MEEKAGLAGLTIPEVGQAIDRLRAIGQGEIWIGITVIVELAQVIAITIPITPTPSPHDPVSILRHLCQAASYRQLPVTVGSSLHHSGLFFSVRLLPGVRAQGQKKAYRSGVGSPCCYVYLMALNTELQGVGSYRLRERLRKRRARFSDLLIRSTVQQVNSV